VDLSEAPAEDRISGWGSNVRKIVCQWLCLLAVTFPARIRGQSEYQLNVVRPKPGSPGDQQFLCAAPYTPSECEKQIAILQASLHRYHAEKLGQWTWVLIRSEDWKSILTQLHLEPNSPAFSHLEMRQTFFEEVLLVPKPERRMELLRRWHIPFDQFLDFAVSHELGHAFCHEFDEIKAERVGQRLRSGRAFECDTQAFFAAAP
jgi:hypothetical protein